MLTFALLVLCVLAAANLLLLLGLAHKTADAAQRRDQYQQANRPGLIPGSVAPEFTATSLQGQPVSSSMFADQPRLLVCISTHCDVCKELLPHFVRMRALAEAQNIQFALLSDDDPVQTHKLLQQYNVDLPVYALGTQTYDFMQHYQFKDFPRYCFINAGNRVESSGYPSLIDRDWRALFEKLANAQKVASAA